MEKLKDILITDRRQQDVNRAKYLLSMFDQSGVWRGSQAEREELESSKGIYTQADVNRVLQACSWLAGRLENYGYNVPGEYFPAALIHITVEPTKAGKIDSILAYKGETVAARAVGERGYEFNRWEENGVTVSEDAEYGFTAEQDRELVAVFDAPLEESGMVGFAVVGRATVGKEV